MSSGFTEYSVFLTNFQKREFKSNEPNENK